MKIPKEYILLTIGGLYLLAYLLEAAVDPLQVELATPYAFFAGEQFGRFPFSTATIVIRGIAVFMTPLFFLSFIKNAHLGKAGTTLILSALIQLYALQEVASGTTLVPLEWSLSLALAGLGLLASSILYLISALFSSAKNQLLSSPDRNPSSSLEE